MNRWRSSLAAPAAALLATLACTSFSSGGLTPTATPPAVVTPGPVEGTPTATAALQPPTPTQTPASVIPPTASSAPVVTFVVDSPTVDGPGQCTTLRWSTEHLAEVRLYGGEYGAAPGQGVTGTDSRPACPAPGVTATYVLRAVDLSGNVLEQTVSVQNVASARRPPQVRNTAVFGASAGLIWNFVALDDGILQLQVQADPNAFTEQPTPVTADGDGIEKVDFVVSKDGVPVHSISEQSAAYCLLGGNGPCNGLAFEDDVYKWSPGGLPVESGDYFIDITITLKDGSNRNLSASFSLEAP